MNTLLSLNAISTADQNAAEAALVKRDGCRNTSPTYILILAAIGGWVSALLLMAATISLVAGDSSTFLFTGTVAVTLGLLLRVSFSGTFQQQIGAGLVAAGQLGCAVGMEDMFTGGATVACTAVALVALAIERRGLLGPTMIAAALMTFGLVLLPDLNIREASDTMFAALCVGLGLGTLLLRIPGRRTEYIGLVALLALVAYAEYKLLHSRQLSALFNADTGAPAFLELWGGKGIVWVGLLALLYWGNEALSKLEILGGAILATLFLLLLPFASNAAFLLMFSGYILGWRPAALSGVATVILTLSYFYYDLSVSLLSKSMLLVGAGAALCAAAYLLQKNSDTEVAS